MVLEKIQFSNWKDLCLRAGVLIPLLLGLVIPTWAQAGTPDTSFRGGVFNGNETGQLRVNVIKRLATEKYLVGGRFTGVGGAPRNNLTRINPDGSADESFGNFQGSYGGSVVNAIEIDSANRILVGGLFYDYNNQPANNLVRLNPDGDTDLTFSAPVVDGEIHSVSLQSDGKILIGGVFRTVNGEDRGGVARLLPNGTLDSSFAPPLGVPVGYRVYVTITQPDGKVLVGGDFYQINGVARNFVARLLPSGGIDLGFSADLYASGNVLSMKLLPDGKIYVGGGFAVIVNGRPILGIARLNSNGSTDDSFDPGQGSPDVIGQSPTGIEILPNGQILIVGYAGYFPGNSLGSFANRLNMDGSRDPSFQEVNIGRAVDSGSAVIHAMAIDPDGKVLLGGTFISLNGQFARHLKKLTSSGIVDPTFNSFVGFNSGGVLAIKTDTLDRIVVAGVFEAANNTPKANIARLNPDGFVDTTFNPGLGPNGVVLAMAIQGDGKILISGNFTQYDGFPVNYFCRVNQDGTLDQGFNQNFTAVASSAQFLGLQSDGRILLFAAVEFQGQPYYGLLRFNSDGSFDPTFSCSLSGEPALVTVQPDGKILLGGETQSINGSLVPGLVRLNPDGSTDPTFQADLPTPNSVTSIHLTADQKILITRTGPAGPLENILRLNQGGSIDASFASILTLNLSIRAVQADGKILVFDASQGLFLRLNEDGTPDLTFRPFGSQLNYGTSVAFQADQKILVAFTNSYLEGRSYAGIARLNNGPGCGFQLSSTGAAFPASGGNGSVSLTTACTWEVTGLPNWVSATAGSGTGNASISFSVAPNNTKNARSATITIGGQPFTINQSATGSVNGQVILIINSITQQTVDPAPGSGYTNQVNLSATLQNFGATLYAPLFFEVLELSKSGTDLDPTRPYRLSTADDFAINGTTLSGGQVGSLQTVALANPIPSNGQVSGINFSILRGAQQRFRFFVSVYASTSAPLSLRQRSFRASPNPVATFLVEVDGGQVRVSSVTQ